jgi:hypothetical protein
MATARHVAWNLAGFPQGESAAAGNRANSKTMMAQLMSDALRDGSMVDAATKLSRSNRRRASH